MGWFWGASSSGGNGDRSQDPLRDLDPSLRDFLKKESPVRYDSSNPPAQPAPTAVPAQKPASSTTPASPTSQPEKPRVPKESAFQDGRYADLWKTYQSQADAESEAKSDQEKIADILQGYKYRKGEIGRAALENCALEQWEVNDCFRNGSWASRMTLCRAENRSLERCYTMQSKFLRALGYLSTFDRPVEVDEQIQMHADTLYHRMLDQEKAIEAAKAEGKPTPTFPPLLSSRPKLSAGTSEASKPERQIQPSELPPSVQKGLKERLESLSGEERILEELAIKAEIAAGQEVTDNLGKIYEKQAEERRQRKGEGKETITDKIVSIFSAR